jgi:ABC-type branched-subunit amino acid transport system substrate-binding protein
MVAGLDNPKVKRAAMITTNDELGVFSANEYFPSDLKKAKLENAGVEFFPPKSQEYAPALERLQRNNPDMLVINCYTPDIIGVFKEMQATGWFPPVVVVEAPTQLPQAIGEAINGVFCPLFWDPSLDKTRDEYIGTSRDFASLYKAKYNADPPDFVAACGANNLVIYAKVLAAAGKIDDPKAINAAFRSLKSETFFSPVQFADDGLNYEGSVFPGQFQKGELVLVYPPDIRKSAPIHPYPNAKR